jgi:hypothetical protein
MNGNVDRKIKYLIIKLYSERINKYATNIKRYEK